MERRVEKRMKGGKRRQKEGRKKEGMRERKRERAQLLKHLV